MGVKSNVNAGEIDPNTTHRSSNGSDHGFLDQSVIVGSSPTFDGASITGLPGSITTVNLIIPGVLSVGDGQQPYKIRLPADGFILEEINAWLEVAAGTQLSIQVAEMDEVDGYLLDVMTVTLDFGTSKNATFSSIAVGRETPDKGHWYRVDIDVITGSIPEGLTVQMILRQAPGLTV